MSRAVHCTGRRCAVYVRMSTFEQKDSPERQRSQVMPYVASKGFELVGEYEDHGIRGDEFEKREGFQRLLADAKAGRFDVIVVDELSRLSRQEVVEFIASVVHPLRQAGVTVDSVAEGPMGWDDVVQLVMLVIRQDKSSGESKQTSRRVLTRLLMSARAGRYVPPIVPYGLRAEGRGDGKRLVPGPEDEVRVIEFIFTSVGERGWSVGRVCAELTRRGVRPPSGNGWGGRWKEACVWHKGTVRKLLRNRV